MPTFSTAGRSFDGVSIDRSVFRQKLPDDKWILEATGTVNAGDTNVATVSLYYLKDDMSTVLLGSVTHNTATEVKKKIGPVDLFGVPGVPAGEAIPMVVLHAIKASGVDGTLRNWNIQVRFVPSRR